MIPLVAERVAELVDICRRHQVKRLVISIPKAAISMRFEVW